MNGRVLIIATMAHSGAIIERIGTIPVDMVKESFMCLPIRLEDGDLLRIQVTREKKMQRTADPPGCVWMTLAVILAMLSIVLWVLS